MYTRDCIFSFHKSIIFSYHFFLLKCIIGVLVNFTGEACTFDILSKSLEFCSTDVNHCTVHFLIEVDVMEVTVPPNVSQVTLLCGKIMDMVTELDVAPSLSFAAIFSYWTLDAKKKSPTSQKAFSPWTLIIMKMSVKLLTVPQTTNKVSFYCVLYEFLVHGAHCRTFLGVCSIIVLMS